MATQEDIIKAGIYKKFARNYFSKVITDGRTRAAQLNAGELADFFSKQMDYVEEEYQKIKYNVVKK